VNCLRIRNEVRSYLDRKADPSYVGLMVGKPRGVTTTEYVLILGVIAVALFGAYRALGNNIGSLANAIDSTLTVTSHGVPVAQSTPKP
jgi:Flp pilus assembly pilin Flp